MATTVIDTAGWQVVVPINPPLNLTGSRLTCTLTDRFGGAVVSLDSATPLPAYGVNQISWIADPVTGLSSSLLLTVTRAMRGGWTATGPSGLPGTVILFGDVQRTVAGSLQDQAPLGRTSFAVMPGTDSQAVASQVGQFQPVLTANQGLQTIAGAALLVGPQGLGFALPDFDPIADAGKTFGLQVVNGALVWVAISGSIPPGVVLAGTISGAGGPAGALTVSPGSGIALAGTIVGAIGPSGGLTISAPPNTALAGAIAALAGPSGGLTVAASGAVALAGAIAAQAGPSGALSVLAPSALALAGAIAAQAGPVGGLTIIAPTALAGVIPGQGALTGALTVAAAGTQPLAGSISSAGGPSGGLTIIAPSALAGAITSGAGPQGGLSQSPGLVTARKGRLAAALAA